MLSEDACVRYREKKKQLLARTVAFPVLQLQYTAKKQIIFVYRP